MSEPNRKIDIFCSLRFNQTGPIKEAKLVKDLLEKEGLNACIIDTEIGGSILAEVVEKLNECKVVILFANEDYGVDTGCLFSSRYELLWSNEKHSAVKETYFDSLDEDFSCDRHPVEGKRLRIKDSNKIKKSQSSYSQKREKFLSSFFSFLSMKKSSLPLTEKKDISLKGSSQSSKDKDQYARFFDENRKPNIMLNLEPLSLKNPEPIIRSLFNAGPDNQDCFCIRNSSPFNMIAFLSRGSEYWAVKPMRTVVLPKNSRKRIHMENEKVVYLTVYRQLEDGRYLLIRDVRPLEIGSEWVGTEEIMTAGIEIVHRLQDTSNHAKVNDSNTFVGLVNYLIIRVHKNADALIQVDLIRNALYIAVLACIGYSIGFLIDKCIQ